MSDMQDQAAQDSLLKTAASESDSQASSAAQSLSHNSADQSMQPLLRSPCRTLLSNLRGERPNPQQHYKVGIYKLHMQGTAGLCSLLSDVDTSPEAATAEGVSE